MKQEDSAVTALRGVRLFEGLDDKTLGRIAQQTRPYRFAEGEAVIDADAPDRDGPVTPEGPRRDDLAPSEGAPA